MLCTLTTSVEMTPNSANSSVCRLVIHTAHILIFFIGKDKKRIDKHAASTQSDDETATAPSTEQLRAALDKIQEEGLPTNPQQMEQYFMQQVSLGEQLIAQGD